MRYRRTAKGLWLPDRELVPPGLCSMFMATQLCGFGAGGIEANVYNAAVSAGIAAANIIGAWDAGALDSYPGSGQSWLDLSANGHDLYLGADGSSSTDDPTFTGTAGDLAAGTYWALDGGDFLTLDQANPAAVEAIHKADATWGMIIGFNYPNSASGQMFMGTTGGAAASEGFEALMAASDKFQVTIRANPAATPLNLVADSAMTTAANHIVGCSINGASGQTGFLYRDGGYDPVGATDTPSTAYTSPDTDNADYALSVASAGNGASPPASGAKIWFAALFATNPSKAQFDAMHAILAPRLGL